MNWDKLVRLAETFSEMFKSKMINNGAVLESRLSSEPWLLLLRTPVTEHTWQLTITCNARSKQSDTISWPLLALGTHVVHTHACRNDIYTHATCHMILN